MAYLFISESSRRPQAVSHEEFDKRFEMAFGKKEPVVCNRCKERQGVFVDGLCRSCRNESIKENSASSDSITKYKIGRIGR